MTRQLLLIFVLLFTIIGFIKAKDAKFGTVIQAKANTMYRYQHDIRQVVDPVRINVVIGLDVEGFQFKMDEHVDCIPQYVYCPSYTLDTLVFSMIDPKDLNFIENGTLSFSYKTGFTKFLNVDPKRVFFKITTMDGQREIPFHQVNNQVLKVSFSDFVKNEIFSLRFSIISEINPQMATISKMNQLNQVSYPKSFEWINSNNTLQLDFINPRRNFDFSLNSLSLNHLLDAPCMNNKEYVTMAYFGWDSNADAVTISDVLMNITLLDYSHDVFGNRVEIDLSTLSIYFEDYASSNFLTKFPSNKLSGSSVSSMIILSPGLNLRVMAVNILTKQELINDVSQLTSGSMKNGQVVSYRIPSFKVPQFLIFSIDLKQGKELDVMATHYPIDSQSICNDDSNIYELNYEIDKQGMNTFYSSLRNVNEGDLVQMNLFFICKSDSACVFDFKIGKSTPVNSSIHHPNNPKGVNGLVIGIVVSVLILLVVVLVIIVLIGIFIIRKRRLNVDDVHVKERLILQ